jgi:hypothetical protein
MKKAFVLLFLFGVLFQVQATFAAVTSTVSFDGYLMQTDASCDGNECETTITPMMNIRCPVSSTVYYIGFDGRRYAHVNSHSYYQRMDSTKTLPVVTIPCAQLDQFPFGGNLWLKPGILLKNELDPKVYVVTAGGVLRHIESEAVAASWFGRDWAKKVIDFPEIFWSQYTYGDVLTMNDLPDGYYATTTDGRAAISLDGVWYAPETTGGNFLMQLLYGGVAAPRYVGTVRQTGTTVDIAAAASGSTYPTYETMSRFFGYPFDRDEVVLQQDLPIVRGTYSY